MAGGAGEKTLEYTPTWVVAVVCTVIVAISLLVERVLHYAGKQFLKKNQKPLYEALLKLKEGQLPTDPSASLFIWSQLFWQLMLVGFISLLLTVTQDRINKICIPKHLADKWLPCKLETKAEKASASTTAHFTIGTSLFSSLPTGRHLLAAEASNVVGYCERKGKAPLLSLTALHHLHIFIFVLAVAHVVFCVLTVVFGGMKIRKWKRWEDSIQNKKINPEEVLKFNFTEVKDHDFVRGRFRGFGKRWTLFGWVQSFFKQFFGSVTKSDYTTLRHGFIETHFRGNKNFDFHKYLVRALEADFKRVVGISWYLWLFVVVFLLLNVAGWHAYFWIAFVPLVLLLAVGTKLEHVITQLAQEVAEKHVAVEGDLIVKPSDHHFWFHRPRLVLILIHIILFQNSFEIAFFFWIWVQYKFDSCIMGEIGYIIPRLVIGVFVQFVCSYSTLPLYAIVTQMGSTYKGAIFEESVQVGLINWAHKAKKGKGWKRSNGNSNTRVGHGSSPKMGSVQMAEAAVAMEEGNAGDIDAATTSTAGGAK